VSFVSVALRFLKFHAVFPGRLFVFFDRRFGDGESAVQVASSFSILAVWTALKAPFAGPMDGM
jgi:hypothetical protein